MKRAALLLALILGLAGAGQAQLVSAKAFPDDTVGLKVSDAMANACNPSTSVTCVIVIEPELAVFPAGSLPTPNARTVILDYRSPTLGPQIAFNGSATLVPFVASFNGGTVTNPIVLPGGSVSAPSLGVGTTNLGFWRSGANNIALVVAGTSYYVFNSSVDFRVGSGVVIGFSAAADATGGSSNVGLSSGGAGQLACGTGAALSAACTFFFKRLRASGGSSHATGDWGSLSAGWGTTASVSAVSGTDQAFTVTIASAGTGQAANPQVTLTFHDGTWSNAPVVVCARGNDSGSSPSTGFWESGSTSATTFVLQFIGTPLAGQSYIANCVVAGR
jgi:hypothetical protein